MSNWTLDQYARFIERQNQNRDARKTPHLEPTVSHAPDGPLQIPPIVKGAYRLRIECWRIRLADSDGISAKALIDWLCKVRDPKDPHWRLLPGDKARDLEVEIVQRHCQKGEPEQTIIEIERNTYGNARSDEDRSD